MAALLPLLVPVSPAHAPGLPEGGAAAPLTERLPAGRVLEVCCRAASGWTSTAAAFARHHQAEGEIPVWIQPAGGALYPPDLAGAGVDLTSLVVVHVPDRAGPNGLARAAELLLRSGAFGLVVVDLTAGLPRGQAWQGRLAGLALRHRCQLVLLTAEPASRGSAGPLVWLRIRPHIERRGPGRFVIEHEVLRDRSGRLGDPAPARYIGPVGLR